jgi:hypothetical protein
VVGHAVVPFVAVIYVVRIHDIVPRRRDAKTNDVLLLLLVVPSIVASDVVGVNRRCGR